MGAGGSIVGVALVNVTVGGVPLLRALHTQPGLFNVSGNVRGLTADGAPLKPAP